MGKRQTAFLIVQQSSPSACHACGAVLSKEGKYPKFSGAVPRSPLFPGKLLSSPGRHGYAFELTLHPCAAAAEGLNTEIGAL